MKLKFWQVEEYLTELMEIPAFGGVPYCGTGWGKSPSAESALRQHNFVPLDIEKFGALEEPITCRFTCTRTSAARIFKKDEYFSQSDFDKKSIVVRLGLALDNEQKITASSEPNRSHLAIARFGLQELINAYNRTPLSTISPLELTDLPFWSLGSHGDQEMIALLDKEIAAADRAYILLHTTICGGFLTAHPDRTLMLGGSSKSLSSLSLAQQRHDLEYVQKMLRKELPEANILLGTYDPVQKMVLHQHADQPR